MTENPQHPHDAEETAQQEQPASGDAASTTAGSPSSSEETLGFPIIGVGASAGGLDALKGLFTKMPDDIDMAFVVIQHLDPSHKSMMGDLLQHSTSLKIVEIEDGIAVEPNV
ncbi:chemotaxis protein CheB, partial [candidate division KSB3 bacterium]|nr:chemotaxis protein CheB [candidate division KSB3 bacterium]MBD3325254.1 chemotaxis protein CheB [candidate division KSB3 bacterium]